MLNKQKGFTVVELVIFVLWLAGAIGWVWNIVKIVHMLSGDITAMLLARCVGVLAFPLGAVLGYL